MFTFSSSYARDVFAQAQERLVTICENYVQEHNTSPDALGTELPNILIAIQICEKQHNLISLGFLIHSTGEMLFASTLYCEALQLATTLADERGKALAMFHLGEIARVQDRIDEALHYLRQSEDIARRMDDQTGLASIYASLGRLYLYQEQYSLALPNLRECVLLESAWGETRILAENLYWLGYALANTGRIEEAQDCFLRARAIFMHMDQERVTDVDRALARLEAALEAGT